VSPIIIALFPGDRTVTSTIDGCCPVRLPLGTSPYQIGTRGGAWALRRLGAWALRRFSTLALTKALLPASLSDPM
jgi:hypothetical protein